MYDDCVMMQAGLCACFAQHTSAGVLYDSNSRCGTVSWQLLRAFNVSEILFQPLEAASIDKLHHTAPLVRRGVPLSSLLARRILASAARISRPFKEGCLLVSYRPLATFFNEFN